MWEWGFTGEMHLLGDKLVINQYPAQFGEKFARLHVINPKREYPHPTHYLIEPTPEMNRENVPMAHDRYLGRSDLR